MASALSAVARRLHQTLIGSAQSGGGWPYIAGKNSRIEPTSWVLLALHDTWGDDAASWHRFAAPHRQWIAGRQRSDGVVVDYANAPANFTANGLAACVVAHLNALNSTWGPALAEPSGAAAAGPAPDLARLVAALVAAKGVSVDDASARQDNRLQGWPWMADTFSWLEPTAWCMLALTTAGAQTPGAAARIQEAEKLILNRTCESGGWNFGNAAVSGQDLRPYVPTTALALIALQHRRDAPEVVRSLAWLRQARVKEPSAMALALTSVCLRLYGVDAADVDARLAADLDRAERVGNLQTLAMMLYALTFAKHEARAFRV